MPGTGFYHPAVYEPALSPPAQPPPAPPEWPIFAAEAGLGLLLGFAMGLTVKKALRLALVVSGTLLLAGILFSQMGLITIHWSVLERLYTAYVAEAGGLGRLLQAWSASLSQQVPVAGGVSLGFFLGLWRG